MNEISQKIQYKKRSESRSLKEKGWQETSNAAAKEIGREVREELRESDFTKFKGRLFQRETRRQCPGLPESMERMD